MFGNFSMPELLIVGALALIVIGPKDLPRMMRSIGKFVGQARGLARQFQRSMDDAAREMDLQEFRDAKALMDKKADTSSVTEAFTKKLDFDEKSDKPARKAMTSTEMAETVKERGFSDDAKKAPANEPAAQSPSQAEAEPDPEPAKASQG